METWTKNVKEKMYDPLFKGEDWWGKLSRTAYRFYPVMEINNLLTFKIYVCTIKRKYR